MRPVNVCHGLSNSTLMEKAVYRRLLRLSAVHSGDVMTWVGRSLIVSQEMRTSLSDAAKGERSLPVRDDRKSKPLAATSPLETPDKCKMASMTLVSLDKSTSSPMEVSEVPHMSSSSLTCLLTSNLVP